MDGMDINEPAASGNHLAQASMVDMEPVAYKGVPVLTTEKLAEALGATPQQLRQNYANNKERFSEGDHLFVVKGAELKQLKASSNFSTQLEPNAPKAILWTERGAFRHAKCLNTPEAWQAYEQLEETYFAVKTGKLLPAPVARERVAPVFKDGLACAKLVGLRGNQAVIAANRWATKFTGVNVLEGLGETKLIEEDKKVSYPPTMIAESMGIKSAIAVNKLLEKYGFQVCRPEEEPRWEPTELGMPHAELITADPVHGKGKARKHWQWYISVVEALTAAIAADTQEG